MRRPWFPLLGMVVMSSVCWANSAPTVTGVSATQRTDGSGIVDIYYTLDDADWNRCTISVKVSNGGGSTWTITPSAGALSGDVGSSISQGSRHIVWASKTDLPGVYGTNYRVQITADDGVPHTFQPGMDLVYISDPDVSDHEGFNGAMSRYETTNAQYCHYLNEALADGSITVSGGVVSGPSQVYFETYEASSYSQITYTGGTFRVRTRDGYSMADHPVVEVSWYGATAFCDYYGYRLPREWEWQAVADFDGTYTYGCGTSIDQSKANYKVPPPPNLYANPLHLTSEPYTTPVDYYPAYGYGMHDMAGNVWDLTASVSGSVVIRGGSWASSDICAVAVRSFTNADFTDHNTGFRVCQGSVVSGKGNGESNIFTIDNRDRRTFYLTISSTAGGAISPGKGTFQYNEGDQVMLEAKADPLFIFVGWRGGISACSNPYLLTMNADYTVKAWFESDLNDLYVDDNAPGDPGPADANISDPLESGTPEHPFDMIQEAIDVAKPGAKVIVRPGTYFETIDLLGKSIEVNGLNSYDPSIVALPIINGQGKDTVVRCVRGEVPNCTRKRDDPNCILTGFVITGGRGRLAGGILCVDSDPNIMNCLIVGNRTKDPNVEGGGGIYCQDSNALFTNCTIAGNHGGGTGAGLWFKGSHAVVTDSIIWGNGPAEMLASGAIQPVIGHTDIAAAWPGTGMLNVDPLFAGAGYWANPNDLAKPVSASDPTAIWVPGDYHLRSQAGRWDQLGEKWVTDAVTSPCIDAGDPALPVGAEPMPNGNRINMGAYGGTNQASVSR